MAATLLVAAPGSLALMPAAHAAGCFGSGGVTVVVDFQQLGGGAQTGCDPAGGGRVAAVSFPEAGFPLTDVQQTPGFTCRVSGKPATDPCVRTPPATAYWSLWWSDGRSGTWSYATVGVGSLKVPEGGYVAFSWQGQAGRALPGISPTPRRSAEPAPTSSPTPDKTPDESPEKPPKSEPAGGSEKSEGPAEPAPASTPPAQKPERVQPTTSSEPSDVEASALAVPSPSADPTPEVVASDPAAPTDEPGWLPTWFSAALIVALAGAAAAAWWRRRPASGGP